MVKKSLNIREKKHENITTKLIVNICNIRTFEDIYQEEIIPYKSKDPKELVFKLLNCQLLCGPQFVCMKCFKATGKGQSP